MPEKSLSCCFTGHRPEKLPWGSDETDPRCAALKQKIRDAVESAYDGGMRHFICGMARGCDFYFAEAVLTLRREKGDVTLEAAIPCAAQSGGWPEADQARWRSLLAQCDLETLVQEQYTKGCMLRRNRYMVDHSALLIAVYDGVSGGTLWNTPYVKKSPSWISPRSLRNKGTPPPSPSGKREGVSLPLQERSGPYAL